MMPRWPIGVGIPLLMLLLSIPAFAYPDAGSPSGLTVAQRIRRTWQQLPG